MRMNYYSEWARMIQQYILSVGFILALAFSPATLSAQNAPTAKPKPKLAAEQQQSVLKVSAEAPCEFYIDDEKKGQVSTDKPLEVPVGVGEHLFKATCEKGGTWELDDKVEAAEQKVVRIRFIVYQGGVVLDAKTGLMWASRDNGSDINWADAKAYCDNYSGGGYSDWRMPTLDEMEEVYYSKSYLRFIQFTGYAVWSAKVRNSSAAYFHFSNGSRRLPHQSNTSGTRALPVRGGR